MSILYKMDIDEQINRLKQTVKNSEAEIRRLQHEQTSFKFSQKLLKNNNWLENEHYYPNVTTVKDLKKTIRKV